MSILEQLASAHNRRDEDLNQQLAKDFSWIAQMIGVQEDIQELVDNLKQQEEQTYAVTVSKCYTKLAQSNRNSSTSM